MTPIAIIGNLGGRKFFMAMGCGVINTVLVWFSKIDGPIYRDVILGTVAVYIAGNAYQAVKGTTSGTPS